MSYTSYFYLLIFLGSVFLFYTVLPKKYKWIALLTSSYIFYWLNSHGLVVFLLLTTVAVYLSGRFLNRIQDSYELVRKSLLKEDKKTYKALINKQKRGVITLTVLFIFGLLVFLKYYNFFGGIFNSTVNVLHLNFSAPKLKLILPLGISYYTLQAASYIIDVYRGKYRASENFGKVALFLCFFPQMVEGPIGRFDLLAEPLYRGNDFDYDNFTQGIQLIFWGLFKKFVIADRANIFVASVFDNYTKYSGSILLMGGIMYTVQIYAEFSGCMDIVTGSAQLFSVPLSKNFERPFFSKSINEFWRRWHITLGAWLRDYVFYTVSLSKMFMKLSKWAKKHLNQFFGSLVPAAFALLFVWFGNGFWHGSGWKYICYGMYYYVIMLMGMLFEPIFRKALGFLHIKRDGKGFSLFKILRTSFLVVIGMILFRSETVYAWVYSLKMIFTKFGFSELINGTMLKMGTDIHDLIIILLAVIVVFIVGLAQERGIKIRSAIAQKNIALRWAIYIVLIMSVAIFGAYGSGYDAVDFIYGQF